MFEGYYDRRCLQTLILSIILSLILIIFLSCREDASLFNQSSYYRHLNLLKKSSNQTFLNAKLISKTFFDFLPSKQKISNGVLSSIGFINSPFLDLDSESSNIIPIIVLSKPSDIEIRDAIRRTWAFDQSYHNNTIQFKVLFLVGIDDYMIKRIQSEQSLFSDVIQVSIPDVYSFSAYKELSAMLWVRTYLPNVQFYIKTEDDIIINIKSLIDNLLPTIEDVKNENIIIGWFDHEHDISRDIYQKYIDAVIPPSSIGLYYAMSLFYIVTSQASDHMLNTLSHIEYIEHPGDPFVTGILRDAAHVQVKNLASSNKIYNYTISNGACKETFQNNSNLLFCRTSIHNGIIHSIPEYFDVWNVVLSQN